MDESQTGVEDRPLVFEMAEILPGPPEVVWELITDWEHQGDWMLEASDFVVLSDARTGEGVEAEATIRIGGLVTRDRVRVVGWEKKRRLEIEHLGWVRGRGEISRTPLKEAETHLRTHVMWREVLVPPLGPAGRLGMSLFKPLMKKTFRRDLRVLAGLVRARSQTR